MVPDRTILHLVENNYGVHTIKPQLRLWVMMRGQITLVLSFIIFDIPSPTKYRLIKQNIVPS